MVLLDNTSMFALEMQELKDDIVDKILQYIAIGRTNYCCLKMVDDIIYQGFYNPNVDNKKASIIFRSDGGNIYFVKRLKKL